MKLTDFYSDVARHSDTQKQGIDVADTSRVLATMFKVLHRYDSHEVLELLAKGIAKACAPKACHK